MGIKHTTVATGINDATKQISVNKWNEAHSIDISLELPVSAPVAPSDGLLSIYASKIGGRTMLMQKGPSGLETSIQPNLGGNKVAFWNPVGGTNTVPAVFGMNTLIALGTATSRSNLATNFVTRMSRLGYVSAATVAGLSGIRESLAKYTTGAGSGMGGFFFRTRFCVSDGATVAGARMFIGLSANTAAPTNVEPSTLINSIGVTKLSTSNNLQIVCGGAVAGTPIDLGIDFPAHTSSIDAYELSLFAASSDTTISYQVTRLNTGHIATGTITTNIPVSNIMMCMQIWRCNNATASAVGIDIGNIYIETDY